MKWSYNLGGGQQLIREIPVRHAATKLEKGAVLIKGTTDDTTEAFAVVGASALADVIGVLEEEALTTETDSNADGTAVLLKKVTLNPDAVYLVEYSQAAADDEVTTSASSSTTFNCTSIEGIAGGWVYGNGLVGTGGQLAFIVSDTTNALTMKSATAFANADTFIKILPRFHQLGAVNTAATKLLSAAAAGTAELVILENYIEADNLPFQRLNPTLHDNLTGLKAQNAKFWAEVYFRDHILNPLS